MSDEETRYCPHCTADLRGKEIPTEHLKNGYYGEWDGETPRYYSQVIGVEVRGVYDGMLYWACPFCGGTWHRWEKGTRQHAAAEKYIRGPHGAGD